MEKYEKCVRCDLAYTLGDLSEALIRRVPPFDKLPLQSEVIPYLYEKYVQYYDEMDVSLREQVLARLIDYAKWEVKSMFQKEIESFNALYPTHVEAANLFKQWIKQREGPKALSSHNTQLLNKNVKATMIIKRIMMERRPDFEYDKSIYIPGTVPFSSPCYGSNKIFLIADVGAKRQFIDFMLGIHYPRAFIDIANFFGKSQSVYPYMSDKDVVVMVHKALDLIDILLPHFTDRLKKALSKCQNSI